jgi:hypothetical protein
MVDVSRIKNRLGTPPDPSQAGRNLAEPETASAWVDGRSLRATGRTAQFATRIKPEYHKKAKLIAARDGITLAELFEKGVDAYEREHPGS